MALDLYEKATYEVCTPPPESDIWLTHVGSSASTKLSITVKMHQNLQICTSNFKKNSVDKVQASKSRPHPITCIINYVP